MDEIVPIIVIGALLGGALGGTLRGLIALHRKLRKKKGCQVCGRIQSQLVVRRTFQNTKGLLEFSDACQTTLQPSESVLLLNQFSFGGD